jgi:hypothetical protein
VNHLYPDPSDAQSTPDWTIALPYDSGIVDQWQEDDVEDDLVILAEVDSGPDVEPDIAPSPDTTPGPSCDDEVQNGDELGVDCGGSCPDCMQPTIFDEFCGGLPTQDTTGVLDESLLTPSGGVVVVEDGSVIENLEITGVLDIRANNVTVRNVRVNAEGTWYAIRTDRKKAGKAHQYPWTGILIEHVEAFGTHSSVVLAGGVGVAPGDGVTIRHSYFHDSGGDATKFRSNVLMECCFYHRIGTHPTAHADGTQIRAGARTEIRYNNCELSIPESDEGLGDPFKSNACVMASAELGPLDDIRIHHNRLQGGNYTVYITTDKDEPHPVTNCVITDNIFGSNYRFGVWQVNTAVDIVDNTCESTGSEPIEKQCACPEGELCGQK